MTTVVERQPLRIGSERIDTEASIEVHSPYSGELVGSVAAGTAAHASAAVDAAVAAMRTPLAAHERALILERIAAGVAEQADALAQLICSEAGKPIRAARVEVARASSTYALAAIEARTLAGDVVPMDGTTAGAGHLGLTLRVPVGVVAAITPFNFPLNLAAHKVAAAFAAGCAVVLKPAEKTPLTAYRLAELSAEAGVPDGWLNVVTGEPASIGDVLVNDERVAALSFTGSSALGWDLRARAPKKRVLLELGNATPVIVAADADIDAAAAAVAANAFSFAGQSCISVQRVLVADEVYESFVARLLPRVESLRCGDPALEDTDVGPLIDRRSRERVLDWIADSGGRVLAGGTVTDDGIVRPTVVEDVGADSHLACDEAFGPVCTVQRFSDVDAALAAANGTRYGLQASVFTRDLDLALKAAATLEFGGVLINEAPTFRADQMPYGGVKDSGNTREGPHYAVRELTEERLVLVKLPR